MISPRHGVVVAPCDATITMIYPTKHALGLALDNGIELLLHFGINTVSLNGQGFELLVNVNQKVKKGDVLWNVDLGYIQEHAIDDKLLVVVSKIPDHSTIEKEYGYKKCEATIMKIRS